MVAKPTQEPERLVALIPPELMKLIKDFRHARQIESRAEAVRRLLEAGLRAEGFIQPGAKQKP